MSYEVTATRRRPQTFDDLVGQDFVAETLKKSITSEKIAHAYLFAGPRGCGKTSTARILAKTLNCQNGPSAVPCGHCSNCMEITKGSSLDVIEIDGASNTSVDNIRQIKEEVMFPANNSRYKIYIIDEVHMLSTSAFNALLKTIEEPPAHVIFIFATTELQKVPATIKSRCQQYNFRLVSIEKVKQCLAEACAEMNIQAEDEALFWVARESTGSLRDAYTLFDQVVAFSDGYITFEKIRDKLGIVGVDSLNAIFEACAKGNTDQVINYLDEFLQNGISIEQLISNSADYLRSLLLIKNGVTKEALLGNSAERYSKLVLSMWNSVQIERALSIYLQLYRDIRYSLSPRYELELAFSRLCWISQFVSNAEVKKAIDAAQSLLAGAPSPKLEQVPQQKPNDQVSQMPQFNQASKETFAPAATVPSAPASASSAASSAFDSPVSQRTQVPNGLPRFSMLDNPDSEIPETEENPNPFYNGGSLPPDQTVEQTDTGAVTGPDTSDRIEQKPLDERLIIHIPQENVRQDNVIPTAYIPEASGNYSFNPDSEEDDGWTNTETPPDDDYYSESSESDMSAYINYADSQQTDQKTETMAPAQLNEHFTTAGGNSISIGQLKGTVIASLAVTDGFVASNLESTGDWKVFDNYVEAECGEYEMNLLKAKNYMIAREISSICEKPMEFRLKLKSSVQMQQEASKIEYPQQVSILVDVFKGTVVAGEGKIVKQGGNNESI